MNPPSSDTKAVRGWPYPAFAVDSASCRALLAGLVALLLVLPGRAFALDPTRDLKQYNCQIWTPQSGLPANGINAITQTKGGFIWLGSQSGLVRYDGVEFKSMELPQNGHFQQKGISSLFASTNGDLWFGILNGAFGLCQGDSRFMALTNQTWVTPSMKVSAIMGARDGALWVGSSAATVRWTTKSNISQAFDFGGVDCDAMFEDHKGRIWLSMLGRGLFFFEGAQMNPFPDPAITNQDTIVFGMAEDHDGQFWFATQYGLLAYDADFHPKAHPEVPAKIRCVLTDREGIVWIGSDGLGLFRWCHGELTNFRKSDGLADDHVTALFEDRDGNLWVGTRGGLNMFSDVKFPLYSSPGGTEQSALFHSVNPAAGGGVWAGSDVGLFRFGGPPRERGDGTNAPRGGEVISRGEQFTYYGTNAGLPVLWLKQVFEASNSDVYFADGAQNVGIFRDGKIVVRFKCPTWPTGFAEDKLGVVAGSGDHLFRVNPGGLTPYPFTNAAPQFGWIHSLNSTRDGTILVAGVNGVFRVKGGDSERFSTANGLPANEAQWVCEDSSNVLWAGLAGGLARIEGNRVDSWTQNDGLFNNNIHAIIPDDQGWLWFHSDNGIFRVRRDSFMVGGHKAGRLHCEVFDSTHDVKTLETADVEFSACETHDGRIWIPSPQGIILINPAHVPPAPAPPAVHIEMIRINGREWSRAARFTAPPGRGELEVQYTAPTFIAPQQQQFRYRLEGYETKWESVGTRRSAFFTNLKPGKYNFLVQACDADGLAGGPSDSVEMELLPFFYQTAWFYFVCAGLGLSVLLGIYAWRVSFLQRERRQMQATQERLEEEVQHRTAELTRANAVLREENLLRQRVEASLVSSREEFKDLFDNAPVGFLEVDAEGRLIRVNNTELKMQGYTAGELLGQFVWKLSADEEAARQSVQAILRDERSAPQNIAQMFRRKDGSTFPVMLNARLLRREDGMIAGIRSTAQDITDIKETQSKLEQAHKDLLEKSRQAGMAEVATNVLHNVGNVLNSVNVSASLMLDNTKRSKIPCLGNVVTLLNAHAADLGGFMAGDAKGRQLPGYLGQLAEQLGREQQAAIKELELLRKNIEHINDIVAMQQSYAKVSGVSETVNVTELVEDALRMNTGALARHEVGLERAYATVPLVTVEKHKVLQILVNLIRNAKYACDDAGRKDKRLKLQVARTESGVQIAVIDNGVGIPPENQTRIFSHGFTTRKGGHGFGLHSGALAAKELGGSLTVHSNGVGQGATFTLNLPLLPPEN